jgi:hypothetical protein
VRRPRQRARFEMRQSFLKALENFLSLFRHRPPRYR